LADRGPAFAPADRGWAETEAEASGE